MRACYADVVTANTSTNGVFGMKLHFNQFRHVFGGKQIGMRSGVSFVKSFHRHVLVYRRDNILQAVSELLATRMELWNTDDCKAAGRAGKEFTDADIPLLTRNLSRRLSEEYAWRSRFGFCLEHPPHRESGGELFVHEDDEPEMAQNACRGERGCIGFGVWG